MNKIKTAIICFVLCSFCAVPAKAQIKMDFGSMGTSISEFVGRIQTKISDVQRYVENQVTMLKNLAGEAQGLMADVQSGVAAAKNAANAAKGAVNAVASGDINGAMSAAQSAASAAGSAVSAAGNVASAAGVNTEITETAGKALAQAQEMKGLEIDLGLAKEKLEQSLKDIADKQNAEIKKYEDNIKLLESDKAKAETQEEKQKYQQAIDKNNEKIKEIKDKYQKEKEEKEAAAKEAIASISKNIDDIKSAAASIESINQNISGITNLSNLTGGLDIKGKLSLKGISDDPGESMNAIIKSNFYGKDEEESSKRNGEIFGYRRMMALEDSADVYAFAIGILSEDDTLQDTIKGFDEAAQKAETTEAMLMLDAKVKVYQMKQFLKFAKIILAELKMETAKDMVQLNRRLNNYDKDVLVFSLDDYQFEKQSFLAKLKEQAGNAGNLLGQASGIAGKISGVTGSGSLGGVSDALGKAGNVTGALSGATGADDVKNAVSSIF